MHSYSNSYNNRLGLAGLLTDVPERSYDPPLKPDKGPSKTTDIMLNTDESFQSSLLYKIISERRGDQWRVSDSIASDYSLREYCSVLYLDPQRGVAQTSMQLLIGDQRATRLPQPRIWITRNSWQYGVFRVRLHNLSVLCAKRTHILAFLC